MTIVHFSTENEAKNFAWNEMKQGHLTGMLETVNPCSNDSVWCVGVWEIGMSIYNLQDKLQQLANATIFTPKQERKMQEQLNKEHGGRQEE